MGAPHSIVLMQCIGEAERYGKEAKPSCKICERSEHVELSNFLNSNKIGDLIA